MNLFQPFRAEVEKAGNAVSDTIDFLTGKINALWNVQHKPDGSHGDITATNLAITRGTDQDVAAGTNLGNVTATGDGPHTFGGDVIAEFDDGTETAIGTLGNVNGVNAVPGLGLKHGILMGGVTQGWAVVKRGRSGEFGGSANTELAIYEMENAPGTAAAVQFARDTSLAAYSLIDGGSGSTPLELGSATRPLQAVYLGTSTVIGIGVWVTPTFAAGDYTGSGTITWTVASGDVTTFAYEITNKRMTVSVVLITTTVAGAGAILQINIPAGKTAIKAMRNACEVIDNGVRGTGRIGVAASGTVLQIQRTDAANWAASTDNTAISAQLTFEIG